MPGAVIMTSLIIVRLVKGEGKKMQAFCVQSVDGLKVILTFALIDRLKKEPPTEIVSHIRSPVCLLFVRPRASPGNKLLEQVEGSFDYWYHATGSTLDIVLP